MLQEVIKTALTGTETYEKDIEAGERKMKEIRRYLDEMGLLPATSDDTEIGSCHAVQTFSSFDDWLGSFSTIEEQEEGDKVHIRNFKSQTSVKEEDLVSVVASNTAKPNEESPSSMMIRLIITDLRKPGAKTTEVEELQLRPNTEIREILRILKEKGWLNCNLTSG